MERVLLVRGGRAHDVVGVAVLAERARACGRRVRDGLTGDDAAERRRVVHAEVVAELVCDDGQRERVVDVDLAAGHVAQACPPAGVVRVEDVDDVVVAVERGADGGACLAAPGRPPAVRVAAGAVRRDRHVVHVAVRAVDARERDLPVALLREVVRDRVGVRDEHALQLRVGVGGSRPTGERDHDDCDLAGDARGERGNAIRQPRPSARRSTVR